ncbi:MAG: ParB-like protein, partial [Pseudomonadota bacterium]
MAEKINSKESDIKYVAVSQLLLDEENPRLPVSVDRDQQSMLDYIAETTAIEELMDAIAENNFFPGE